MCVCVNVCLHVWLFASVCLYVCLFACVSVSVCVREKMCVHFDDDICC
jgi:hypothetical protein